MKTEYGLSSAVLIEPGEKITFSWYVENPISFFLKDLVTWSSLFCSSFPNWLFQKTLFMDLSFDYILFPVMTGTVLIILMSILINKIVLKRNYPTK